MKKIIVMSYEFPPFNGGVGVVAKRVQKSIGGQSVVLTLKGEEEACGVSRKLTDYRDVRRYFDGIIYLILTMAKHRSNTIIAVCPTSQRVCWLLSHLLPIKYVNLVMGSEIFWNAKKRRFGLNLLSIYERSLMNFPISNYVKGLLVDLGVKKYELFECGLSEKPVWLNKAKNRNAICSISRLDRRKGHHEIISALALLKKRDTNFSYCIAGTGPERQRLEELSVKLGLDDSINFVGEVTEFEKNEILATSKIYVLHSIENNETVEGYGISYLEAACFCDCVIGSDHGGVPEALSRVKNGRIVKSKDILELVNTLHDCLHLEGDFSKGQAEFEATAAELDSSWDKSVSKVMSFF